MTTEADEELKFYTIFSLRKADILKSQSISSR